MLFIFFIYKGKSSFITKEIKEMTDKIDYKFMPLSQIIEKEPDMKQLKVSEVARSPRGEITMPRGAH